MTVARDRPSLSGVDMNDLSLGMEEVSIDAAASLGSEDLTRNLQGVVKSYPPHRAFFDREYSPAASPSSIFASRSFLRSLPKPSRGIAEKDIPRSRLESLPNELSTNMMRYLDIASLVKFAATSSGMRSLVLSMHHVKTVKSHALTISALNRMLRAGSAKFFTLQRFVDTVKSPTCTICKDKDNFAPWICLVLCHRICFKCVMTDEQTLRITKDMAVECLGLSTEDVARGLGTATIALQPGILRSAKPLRNDLGKSRTIRCDKKIDIVSLKTALTLSLGKYATVGGPSYVKQLIERFLEEHHPDLINSGRSTAIAENWSVGGLSEAIQQEWKEVKPDQHWVLIAYVPHLHPGTAPLRFETGVLCEGCLRNRHFEQPLQACPTVNDLAEKAYLTAQYSDHFVQCEMAQSILRGERFNYTDTARLMQSLHSAAYRVATPGHSNWGLVNNILLTVEVDGTPSKVRAAVSNALQRIRDVENRQVQEGTSTRWPTASQLWRPGGN